MLRKSFVLMVMGMVVFFLCSVASADVPDSVNYQGKLTTASGGCLNDTVQMTFTIYADESGTVSDWSETQMEVAVKEGIFNVLLGSVNPLPASIFDGTAKYLGVQVESDPEMSPLKPMVTTAYAFGSHHAQEADTADYARAAPAASDGDWEFSGGDIYRLDGNVGIGTDAPAAKLHITGGELQINTDQVGGYYSRIDGNEITGGMIGPPGTHHLHIKPGDNSSYLLLAEDGGNVGIGTTTPSSKFHVNGNFALNDGITVTGLQTGIPALRFYSKADRRWGIISSTGGGEFVIKEMDSNWSEVGLRLTIKPGGDVGIGTYTPNSKLEVAGTIHSTSGGIKFPDGTTQTTAAIIPYGVIVMWSGTLASIPSGWALCDGTNGTPDLRDRFIYGCSAAENPGAVGGNTSHNHSVDIAPFACVGDAACWWSYSGIGGTCQPNYDHTHTVNPPPTNTSSTTHLPPYYKLAFIMKL